MPSKDNGIHKDRDHKQRIGVIQSVKSPLGYFTLVVLVIEGLLFYLATKAEGKNFTLLLLGMILSMLILIVFVPIMVIRNPGSLVLVDPYRGDKSTPTVKNESNRYLGGTCKLLEETARRESSIKHARMRSKYVEKLEEKLKALQSKNRSGSLPPFILLGSTYLDVVLGPITTKHLTPQEWVNLDPAQIKVGGSAVCVGR